MPCLTILLCNSEKVIKTVHSTCQAKPSPLNLCLD